jgi:hypothetical protein
VIFAPLLATVALACPAAPVHYEWSRLSPATSWIAAGTGPQRLVGLLGTYEPTLGDRRVREAAGLTLHAGATHKIGWLPRRWEGTRRTLRVVVERVDGPGRLTYRFPRALAPQFFPSSIKLPTAGCWRLTLTSGTRSWTLHARAIDPRTEASCDATAVSHGPNPVDPFFTTWIGATPGSARIFGTFSVSAPGVEGASIYSGGRFPDGVTNTKVLWLVDEPSGALRIRGARLDAQGSFTQTASAAASPAYAYPSILVVPEAGCWLLKLRTSGRGGVVVMRALAP